MPLYDYRCDKCGHEEEVSHPIVVEYPPPCPKCDNPMTKLIKSANTFILKGSGWTSNDSKGKYHE